MSFFITAGQVSDYSGAVALLDDLPKAQWMLADRAMTPNGSGTRSSKIASSPAYRAESPVLPVKYDKCRYKRRNRIETMFGRLKDLCRMATRYDRCPTVFYSALALAATVF